MRSSNLGNISIAIPTESRLRSFAEIDDKSMIINETDQPQLFSNPIFNETAHLQKWLKCRDRVQKRYLSDNDNDASKNSNCYMIQIDDINEIQYKKKNYYKEKQKNTQRGGAVQYERKQQQDNNKVYVKVIVNLVNTQKMDYKARTLEFNIVQLQPTKSPTIYKVTDPRLVVFFHSKLTAQSQHKIRIELSILESNLIDLQQVVQHEQYLGFLDIDPFKGLKTKQRGQIYSPKFTVNLETVVLYTILVSDSFKVLQKLIPPNCLCSSEQSIPGLAGRKLPNTIMSINHGLEYTELHSLKIDVSCVNIPDMIINSKLKQCEQLMKHFQNVQTASASVKQVKLEGVFHNGWTTFCESSIRLEDKMQIQKKNSKRTEIIKIKHFTTEELFNLPFIFLDEEALLIFQLSAKVEIKCKSDLSYAQTIQMPLCYAFYAINKVSVDQKQTRTLYVGDGVNIDSYQFGNKRNQSVGQIQFYINIEQANKMHLSKHLVTLHSNKSHTEVDRIVLQKQRMIRENRKLKQQNRINKIELNQQIPILDTTNFKQNLYRNQIQRLREQRREKEQTLEYLKRKIKQLTPSLPDDSRFEQNLSQQLSIEKRFLNRSSEKKYFDSIFYKAVLQRSGFINNITDHNPDAIDVYIHSFFKSRQATQIHQSGEVPIDIIKTELLQKNYSYAFFINWVSLLPVSTEKKLPRNFYFETNFFKNQNLKSCICTINQSTGQIEVFDEQEIKKTEVNPEPVAVKKFTRNENKRQKTQKRQDKEEEKVKKQTKRKMEKIFYVEVKPETKTKNSENSFIEFVSYMYHSELQIKIIDSISGIQFGQCFFKLKDLIRMRRNEVSIVRDIWVTRNNEAKAKLKMEIKALRQQPTIHEKDQTPKTVISQVQALSMQPQARMLQRIATFKKQKEGISSKGLSKVQKMLNQELTKQELYLKVQRMKGQFIKLQIVNRKNFTQSYKVAINDPDRTFLNNQELVVVNTVLYASVRQTRWWKYLNLIDPLKFNNLIITDQRNCFELNPGQSGSILLYYYSDRKYEGNYESDQKVKLYDVQEIKNKQQSKIAFNKQNQPNAQNETQPADPAHKNQILRVYNHKRCVDLTLSNSSSNYLYSIYKIHIIPQPDVSIIKYRFVRKSHSKILIEIPYNLQKNYVLYIDNPTVISFLNQNQGYASLECYTEGEGQSFKFNTSILTPFPENRLLLNYQFEFWGAHEISLDCQLWQSQELLIDLHSSICMKKGLEYVLALSEDQKILSIRDKNPIKVNQKQSKTMVRVIATSNQLGINHYQLNIVSPIDYSIVYRYTIKIQTQQPQIAQKLTLRIKLTDKMIQEPFGFKNQFLRKQRFKILTTHPHILWCPQDVIDVDAKSQKKIKIKINAEEITETQGVILSFIGEKTSLHYLFILQLDNQL